MNYPPLNKHQNSAHVYVHLKSHVPLKFMSWVLILRAPQSINPETDMNRISHKNIRQK